MDGWSWASEFDHGDEVVRVAEAVGHADGDLDLVVERFDPGVGMAEPDGCEDVVAACADLPAWFDDLGDAAAGRGFKSRRPDRKGRNFNDSALLFFRVLGHRVHIGYIAFSGSRHFSG